MAEVLFIDTGGGSQLRAVKQLMPVYEVPIVDEGPRLVRFGGGLGIPTIERRVYRLCRMIYPPGIVRYVYEEVLT